MHMFWNWEKMPALRRGQCPICFEAFGVKRNATQFWGDEGKQIGAQMTKRNTSGKCFRWLHKMRNVNCKTFKNSQ